MRTHLSCSFADVEVFAGSGNPRMFSAAPGAEARYRNGSVYGSPNVFGNSGSSLFPTKMR